MSDRLDIIKTCKLFIGGKSPRSESGRTIPLSDSGGRVLARIAHASRKDARDAVDAASAALGAWRDSTAYLRGQVLYRWSEMLQSRRGELVETLQATTSMRVAAARKEVDASIDRVVTMAGWCDKLDQLLGCRNPVAGPYHNHTLARARGVVAVFAPSSPALLGLVTLTAAALVPGNTLVVSVPTEAALGAVLLSEMLAVSDVPPGAVNILTGPREELLEPLGGHGAVHLVLGSGLAKGERTTLRHAAADSILRPVICLDLDEAGFHDDAQAASPWLLEGLVDFKTIWHPAAI
ncbi:MAG: aldehyde dehydrogenase family protein [Phycisphaerales bacterium]|nr:aldehyde dehydrogenase family protein [Phycisphaerales bacterium]